MRVETTTRTLYKFSELSEAAQKKAVETYCETAGEYFETEFVYDDFERICNIMGVELRQTAGRTCSGKTFYRPAIYYSGFWSQGDGACYEGTYSYKKGCQKAIRAYTDDTELHRIADELTALQKPWFYRLTATMTHSGHYYHAGCMDVDVELSQDNNGDKPLPWQDLTEVLRDLARWLYRTLESDYEYQTSEACARDALADSDCEFTQDGRRA